jgi:hypothetical protein
MSRHFVGKIFSVPRFGKRRIRMYVVHVGIIGSNPSVTTFFFFFLFFFAFAGPVVARLHSDMYTTTTTITTDRERERSVNYFLSHDIIPAVLVVVLGLK